MPSQLPSDSPAGLVNIYPGWVSGVLGVWICRLVSGRRNPRLWNSIIASALKPVVPVRTLQEPYTAYLQVRMIVEEIHCLVSPGVELI